MGGFYKEPEVMEHTRNRGMGKEQSFQIRERRKRQKKKLNLYQIRLALVYTQVREGCQSNF